MAEIVERLNEQDVKANGPWDERPTKKNVSMSHSRPEQFRNCFYVDQNLILLVTS